MKYVLMLTLMALAFIYLEPIVADLLFDTIDALDAILRIPAYQP